MPRTCKEAGITRLFHRRDIGEERTTLVVGQSQNPECATPVIGHKGRLGIDTELDLARKQRGNHRCATTERNMGGREACRLHEPFDMQVIVRANTWCAEIQLAGIRLRIGDKLRNRVHRQTIVDDQCGGHGGQHRSRNKLGKGIEIPVLVDLRQDLIGRSRCIEQRIAVGFGARDLRRAGISPRTAVIVDHDALAKNVRHLRSDNTGHDIGGTSGGGRDDQRDLVRRIGLGRSHIHNQWTEEAHRNTDSEQAPDHCKSPPAGLAAAIFHGLPGCRHMRRPRPGASSAIPMVRRACQKAA